MVSESLINAVKKLIPNIVLKGLEYNHDLSIVYNETYNKIVIYLNVIVDTQKFLQHIPTYDQKYSETLRNLEENLNKSIKWLGLTWENTTTFITFQYINDYFLQVQTQQLYTNSVHKLKELGFDDDLIDSLNLAIEIRHGEEDNPYIELEIHFTSDDDETDSTIRDTINMELVKTKRYLRGIYSLYLDDLVNFWNEDN